MDKTICLIAGVVIGMSLAYCQQKKKQECANCQKRKEESARNRECVLIPIKPKNKKC